MSFNKKIWYATLKRDLVRCHDRYAVILGHFKAGCITENVVSDTLCLIQPSAETITLLVNSKIFTLNWISLIFDDGMQI